VEKKRKKRQVKAIKINIARRTVIVDDKLAFYKKKPIPSWIELSIIDVCNKTCSFCPKSNPKIAPNTFQKMGKPLIKKLCRDLKKIKYKGSVVLCGYGEPMLHNDVYNICDQLSKVSFVEVVTNGDTLNHERIKRLYVSNVNKLLISMYEGSHQVKKFSEMREKAEVPKDFVILRDRWHDEKKDYGLKLTNRAGTVNIGIQDKVEIKKKCYYPSYQMLIDWNGDVFLCPQDWHRKITMGNIMQESIYNIWTNKIIENYRKKLLCEDRSLSPCNLCNAEGTVLGKNHAQAWSKIYNL
jgi:radical SAM protein with 4Fe4S-binding SPASM domain